MMYGMEDFFGNPEEVHSKEVQSKEVHSKDMSVMIQLTEKEAEAEALARIYVIGTYLK